SEDAAADGGAAIIYITTKKQSLGHHFHAAAAAKTYFYNPFDTYSTSFGYDGQLAESTFLKANGKFVFAENQFIFKNSQGKNKLRRNNEVVDGAASASASHYFGGGSSLTVSEQFYGGRKRIPGTEHSTTVGLQQDYNNILSASVSAPAAAKNLNMKAALSWISNNQLYEAPAEDSRHLLNELAFSAAASIRAAGFFKESLGTQMQLAFLDSTDVGAAAQFSGFIKSTSEFSLGETFTILIPLSLAFSNKNIVPIPKIGIRADLPYVSLLLNGSRLYLFPDLNQLYWKDSGTASGNPDLKPERGWGGELTANVHDIWLPFSISFYTNYYSNKIQWQADGMKWTPKNVASAFYAGINLLAEKTVFNCLTFRAQYEYLYNRLLGKGNTYGNKIMYTPEHVASVSATYSARFVTVYVDAHYVSKRYLSNLNIGSLEPYVLLNASVNFKPAKWITPYIKLNNMLNADYEQSEGYPMPGISLESGVKCSW
ncbi:MAG: TonB-dependent receptor, partial [Treponemataceae bacterium]|nr:TonB-dependent receptor [Treponemataceae bacterium]